MSPRLAHLCQWLEYNVCCVPCRWFMALRCVVTAETGADLIYLAIPASLAAQLIHVNVTATGVEHPHV